jgi:hypothetical protein
MINAGSFSASAADKAREKNTEQTARIAPAALTNEG